MSLVAFKPTKMSRFSRLGWIRVNGSIFDEIHRARQRSWRQSKVLRESESSLFNVAVHKTAKNCLSVWLWNLMDRDVLTPTCSFKQCSQPCRYFCMMPLLHTEALSYSNTGPLGRLLKMFGNPWPNISPSQRCNAKGPWFSIHNKKKSYHFLFLYLFTLCSGSSPCIPSRHNVKAIDSFSWGKYFSASLTDVKQIHLKTQLPVKYKHWRK